MTNHAVSRNRTIKRSLLLSLIYYISGFAISAFLAKAVSGLILRYAPSIPHDYAALFRNGLLCVLALGTYALLVRRIEKRAATEVDPIVAMPQFAAGALLGVALIVLTFGALWIFGAVRFGQVAGGGAGLMRAVALPTAVAILEELLFRIVLFGVLEQIAGTAAGAISSAALFGLAHAGNPGANAFDIGALVAGLGVLLAFAYGWSRNIGFPAGIHMGWNFAQASIFGASVSGLDQPFRLLRVQLAGPDWLTGGGFGVEGSLVALGLCIAASSWLLILLARRNRWRPLAFTLSAPLNDAASPLRFGSRVMH